MYLCVMDNFTRVQEQLKEMWEDGRFNYSSFTSTLDRHTASRIVNGGGGYTQNLCLLCDEANIEITLTYKPKKK